MDPGCKGLQPSRSITTMRPSNSLSRIGQTFMLPGTGRPPVFGQQWHPIRAILTGNWRAAVSRSRATLRELCCGRKYAPNFGSLLDPRLQGTAALQVNKDPSGPTVAHLVLPNLPSFQSPISPGLAPSRDSAGNGFRCGPYRPALEGCGLSQPCYAERALLWEEICA